MEYEVSFVNSFIFGCIWIGVACWSWS